MATTPSKKTSKASADTVPASAGRKSPTKSPASRKTAAADDATDLLRADHERVSDLFEQYEGTRSQPKKKSLVASICRELTIHAQVEEEIFYPAVKAAIKDKELVPEATVEHATLKDLIAQVQDQEPDGEMFDAKIQVMSEYVKHHVKEEQDEMFPKAKASKLDLLELGRQIAARKEELMAGDGLPDARPGALSEVVQAR